MKTILALALLATTASAQDATQPPADVVAKFVTHGTGVQIYNCTGTGDTFEWKLQEPQADLLLDKSFKHVGTHSKGPTWTWADGSAITGTVVQKQDAPDPTKAIPWLLLTATSTGTNGALSNVTYVRRSDTDGGVAQTTGCSAQTVNTTSKVPYKAVYTFYMPKPVKPSKQK
jgi:hypothetical protein